jgi:hypothetical protein
MEHHGASKEGIVNGRRFAARRVPSHPNVVVLYVWSDLHMGKTNSYSRFVLLPATGLPKQIRKQRRTG